MTSSTDTRESPSTDGGIGAAAEGAALPRVTGLSGEVGPDRRLVLNWSLDPAYSAYEIHESTANPADTLKVTQAGSPRTSNPLTPRPTPLRYGVRGRTADGVLGPFGNAVEVLVRPSGGTVTVTDEAFTLPGGGGPGPQINPDVGVGMTWLVHPDGTPVKIATGGGNAAPTSAGSIDAIPTSGVVRYTGPAISSVETLKNRSNLTLLVPDGKMAPGGALEFDGRTTNVRLEIQAPYENASGSIVRFRGAYDTVTVINSLFGPATPTDSPPADKSRFVMFGDSRSAGSRHGSVVLSTLRNKNGPGNPVHAAGNDGDRSGTGGVRYTYIGLNWIYGTQPFDDNDHESALMGLSELQLTNGEQLVEGNLFGGPYVAKHAVASEPEVISMKMNNSVIRGNTFWNHVGSACLRHGDDGQIVHNNFRSNHEVKFVKRDGTTTMHCGAGGRLYGKGHRFANNTVWVMDGLPTQKHERPFLADTGKVAPGSTSNEHADVLDLVCEDNLFHRCGNGGGPIFDGDNYDHRATGTVRDNFIVACPSPGPGGVTVVGSASSRLTVTGNQIHDSAADAGVTLDDTGWPTHPDKGAKAPFLTPGMVGLDGTWRPPGWTGAGPSIAGDGAPPPDPDPAPAPTPDPAPRPRFPGDLIPVHWKLTTTLGPDDEDPLEIFRDGHTEFDGEPVDLDTYVHPDHWRLTKEPNDRWGIKITCPAKGATTGNSENTRWELRGLNRAGTRHEEFDLVDDAPILDTEVCVLEMQGNHIVLSQIHGQDTDGENDDLTVWRAEPNEDDDSTYSLWITDGDEPHGHRVDGSVRYGQVIHIGFRPADDRVRYVYNGRVLDYEMEADYSTVNYYKAGLYLQIEADEDTSGTIVLYKAQITWR